MIERQKIKSFTDLIAWKEAHSLVLEIYNITRDFPKEELFALVTQLRRAAVSITSNIAEGFSRNTHKEKIQFYRTSLGSLAEIQSQLLIARDVGYLNMEDFKVIADKTVVVSKLINGLVNPPHNFLMWGMNSAGTVNRYT